MDEKSLSPLFPVGEGGGGQWLQMTGALYLRLPKGLHEIQVVNVFREF